MTWLRPYLRPVLLALPLLLVALALPLSRPPTTQPLTPGSHVVLLLAPGFSEADLGGATTASGLGALRDRGRRGVFPTRFAAPRPDEDALQTACRTLGEGERGAPLPGGQALASVLARGGVRTAIVADDGGGARALLGLPPPAPFEQQTPDWRIVDESFPDSTATDTVRFVHAIQDELRRPGQGSLLVVASFDDLYRADRYAPLALPAVARSQRSAALARFDRVLMGLENDQTTRWVIAAPLPPRASEESHERLSPLLLYQPDAPAGLLTSPSTRNTPGLIAATDLGATLAALTGIPPDAARVGSGRPARWLLRSSPRTLDDEIPRWAAQGKDQRLLIYVPWILASLLLAAAFWSPHPPTPSPNPMGRGAGGVELLAVALSFPLAQLLAALVLPLSAPHGSLYLFVGLLCLGAGVGLWRTSQPARWFSLLGEATLLCFLLPLVLGGWGLDRAPLSFSVQEASRFYGMGNETTGALIGASLLAARWLCRDSLVSAFLLGAAVTLAVGHPLLGANAGDGLGALAGFTTLALCLRPTRGNERRAAVTQFLVLSAALTAALIAVIVYEMMRPEASRSHVGLAIDLARTNGFAPLLAIIARKVAINLHLLISSPWSVLLGAELATLFILHRRFPNPLPETRAYQNAVLTGALVLLVFNDSGIVSAATCLLFASPLWLWGSTPQSESAPP